MSCTNLVFNLSVWPRCVFNERSLYSFPIDCHMIDDVNHIVLFDLWLHVEQANLIYIKYNRQPSIHYECTRKKEKRRKKRQAHLVNLTKIHV